MPAVSPAVMPQARGTGPLSPASSQGRELSPSQKCPMPLRILADFPFCLRPGEEKRVLGVPGGSGLEQPVFPLRDHLPLLL